MAKYALVHQTAAGSDLGIINVTNGANVRAKIYELIIGSDATPADLAGEFVVNRTSTAGGTGTTLTPEPLDTLTVAATTTSIGGTYTAQPTDTAATELLMIGLNQRATWRWVTEITNALIGLAAATSGLFLRSVAHGGTPNINATIHFEE